MMRRFIIVLSCVIWASFSWNALSQTQLTLSELVSTLSAPYENLDNTIVNTGYRMDQALDLVNIGLFDGRSLCDSNYVDVETFCDLFVTLNYARVNSNATEYNANQISSLMTSSSNVKLSSALFRFNYIREDAITQGLIDYDDNQDAFYDKYSGGILQNPYAEDYVFMFSAGRHIT